MKAPGMVVLAAGLVAVLAFLTVSTQLDGSASAAVATVIPPGMRRAPPVQTAAVTSPPPVGAPGAKPSKVGGSPPVSADDIAAAAKARPIGGKISSASGQTLAR